jgi:hypothetical protein
MLGLAAEDDTAPSGANQLLEARDARQPPRAVDKFRRDRSRVLFSQSLNRQQSPQLRNTTDRTTVQLGRRVRWLGPAR